MLTLSAALQRCARLYGSRRAIVDRERTFTWREHLERVARAAGVLRSLGLASGERFGVLSRNSYRMCELLHAGYWSGIVPVPINVRLAPPEIAHILADGEVKALVAEPPFLPLLEHELIKPYARNAFVIAPQAAGARLPDYESLLKGTAPAAPRDAAEDEDAILLYTGGTTGRGKGVRLTHRNVIANGMQCIASAGFRESDTYLHVAPMFHSADLLGTGFTLLGCAHAYLEQFSPKGLLAALQDAGATWTMLPPTMIILTLQQERPSAYDLSALRMLFYGSAPMAPEWIKRAIEAFPGVAIAQGYGLTETSPILTVLDFAEHQRALASGDDSRLRAAGRPIVGVDLRVVDAERREVPAGEAGEVAVRGPNVTAGYLKRPDANRAAFVDGWFHTGDIGRVDQEGFLYLLDRKHDLIITGGENVYSSEVEQALYQHPDVSECAVIGVPHATWGEGLVAVIVPAPGKTLTAEALIAHCRDRIGDYKIPREIVVVGELPKSAMGKVLKTELRKRYGDPANRQFPRA